MFLLNVIQCERGIFNFLFTIQNVPIKSSVSVSKSAMKLSFTIQNVPIKSYLPQTTYIVYHFSSFLSIPIFLYIFIKNFFLSFYKTIKKSNKNRYYRKSVDVLAFYCYYRSTDFV